MNQLVFGNQIGAIKIKLNIKMKSNSKTKNKTQPN